MVERIILWFKGNRIHIWIWIFYIFYENVVIGILFDIYAHPLIYIVHYAIIIGFFYLHANYLLPKALGNKRKMLWKAFLIVIVQIPVYITLHFLANYILAIIHFIRFDAVKFNAEFVLRNFYRGFYFMAISTGYYFLKNYLNERKKTEELEREKLQDIIKRQRIEQELIIAQNAYLKAQINPHFLFNTLDFVYHNVNMHSAVAGEAIIRLSEMMRFAIDSDQMDGKILLSDEIEQVSNLIFLNQIRKNSKLHIDFNHQDSVMEFKIIPLVILTLVENIFKHGNLINPEMPANISIKIVQDKLIVNTCNLMNVEESVGRHGYGLINVQKRLQQVYGNEAKLVCITEHNKFLVELSIPIGLLK
jgi:two-component system LytT family sensor kinase